MVKDKKTMKTTMMALLVCFTAETMAQDKTPPSPVQRLNSEEFKRFDTNGDGRLDDEERAAAQAERQTQARGRVTAAAARTTDSASTATKPIPGVGPLDDIVRVHTGFNFTEGPASDNQGNVYFTDVSQNRIHKLDSDGRLATFLENSSGCNGLMFDRRGRLLACQGMEGRIVAVDVETKAVQVIADKYEGRRFNMPNDLVADYEGGVYFTDPAFRPGGTPQEKEGVYYISPKGEVTRVIDNLKRPNGVILSPDGKTLYVLSSSLEGLSAHPVERPGTIGLGSRLGEVKHPGDGMTIDTEGNLYVTQPRISAIQVTSAEGKTLGMIQVPEPPTNCAFGGKEMKTLYITART